MNLSRRITCSLAIIWLASVATANAATITFDTLPLGTTPLFVVTEDGTTATFSSTLPAFFVDDLANQIGDPAAAAPFSGKGLFDVQGTVAPLSISFSNLLSSIVFDFGLNVGNSLTLQAFSGGSGGVLVGTNVFPGTTNIGGFDLGSAGFSGSLFDTIVLTRTAPDFGMDNIQFTSALPSPVPEPASLLLMGTGAVALLAKRRRRKQQAH